MAVCKGYWSDPKNDLGIAKITVSLLIGLALPVLFVSLIFIGGIALLVPIAMIAIAVGIVKACV